MGVQKAKNAENEGVIDTGDKEKDRGANPALAPNQKTNNGISKDDRDKKEGSSELEDKQGKEEEQSKRNYNATSSHADMRMGTTRGEVNQQQPADKLGVRLRLKKRTQQIAR